MAVTPDGKLAVVAAPTRYDYAAKKELFGNFVQLVDIKSTPPKLLGRLSISAPMPTASRINRDGALLLAASHDGTVKVLAIDGKSAKMMDYGQGRRKEAVGNFVHTRRKGRDRRPAQ